MIKINKIKDCMVQNILYDLQKILSKYKRPIVILKAGFYSNEIKSDIVKNINSEVIFI